MKGAVQGSTSLGTRACLRLQQKRRRRVQIAWARYAQLGSLGLIPVRASCEKFEAILEADWVTLETVRRFHMGGPCRQLDSLAQIAAGGGSLSLINRRPRAVGLKHKPPVPP